MCKPIHTIVYTIKPIARPALASYGCSGSDFTTVSTTVWTQRAAIERVNLGERHANRRRWLTPRRAPSSVEIRPAAANRYTAVSPLDQSRDARRESGLSNPAPSQVRTSQKEMRNPRAQGFLPSTLTRLPASIIPPDPTLKSAKTRPSSQAGGRIGWCLLFRGGSGPPRKGRLLFKLPLPHSH